jgi:hypothetical protein
MFFVEGILIYEQDVGKVGKVYSSSSVASTSDSVVVNELYSSQWFYPKRTAGEAVLLN